MHRLKSTRLALFSKVANGAMIAIRTRTLEQPEEHQLGFETWCYKTQFARIFEAGTAVL